MVPSKSKKGLREQARLLYMSGVYVDDIAELTGGDLHEIKTWIYGKDLKGKGKFCWKEIKRRGEDSVIAHFIRSKASVLEASGGKALQILVRSLTQLDHDTRDGDKKLSIKEMKQLTEILTDLDKIVRLEDGKPTEIFSKETMTVEQARLILEQDPFALGIVKTEAIVKESERKPLSVLKRREMASKLAIKPKEIVVVDKDDESTLSGDGECYLVSSEVDSSSIDVKEI